MSDIASARGHGYVLATCDAARGREATKELLNLLQEAAEVIYPVVPSIDQDEEKSVQDMLKAEIDSLKTSSSNAQRPFVSVNTDSKGLVMVIVRRADWCARALVLELFNRVSRTSAACSRHLVRVIPLQASCFPNEDELRETVEALIKREIPSTGPDVEEEDGEPAAKKQRSGSTYCVEFKTRNHDTLKRDAAYGVVNGVMPAGMSVDYKEPQVVIKVEAFRSICGVTVFKDKTYSSCLEMNLRKYQTALTVMTHDGSKIAGAEDGDRIEEEAS